MGVSHESALRDLNPLDLCEQVIGDLVVPRGTDCPCEYCSIRRIDAGYLDVLQTDIESSLVSIFSYEQAAPLEDWEAMLGLSSDSSLTLEQRWERVRAARITRNGLSKAFFEALAVKLGYVVSIERGVYPFRVGISKIGTTPLRRVNRLTTPDPLDSFDIRNQTEFVRNPVERSKGMIQITPTNPYPSDFWTWVVDVTSIGANADSSLLKARFEALKPHYSQIVWRGL
ncbi:MAG: putative phage tail protein [Fibrobacterota bacterium]